jgi:hypothetical protein
MTQLNELANPGNQPKKPINQIKIMHTASLEETLIVLADNNENPEQQIPINFEDLLKAVQDGYRITSSKTEILATLTTLNIKKINNNSTLDNLDEDNQLKIAIFPNKDNMLKIGLSIPPADLIERKKISTVLNCLSTIGTITKPESIITTDKYSQEEKYLLTCSLQLDAELKPDYNERILKKRIIYLEEIITQTLKTKKDLNPTQENIRDYIMWKEYCRDSSLKDSDMEIKINNINYLSGIYAAMHPKATQEQIESSTKTKEISKQRAIICYLLRQAELSYPKAGKLIKKNHATVILNCRKIEKKMKEYSPEYQFNFTGNPKLDYQKISKIFSIKTTETKKSYKEAINV